MFWDLSRFSQVLPPSSDRYNAGSTPSIKEYTILLFEGAYSTSIRPYGLAGNPFLPASNSLQFLPPSMERKMPLPLGASGPSPPERKVQPLRRKSHMPEYSTSEFCGSIVTEEQPVDRFLPLSIKLHVLPPSAVLY